MTRVAVSGAAGRMGRLAAGAVAVTDDLDLAVLFDPGHPGGQVEGLEIAADPAALGDADVVVEFTNPDVVMDNLTSWRALGIHAVVGTSGFDAARMRDLEETWGDGPPNCLVVPNFSIGAVLSMYFAEVAARHFAAAEVIELHHEDKPDAPSGTAIATAERIAAAQGGIGRSFSSRELVEGARGGAVAGVPVHSVRVPGIIASQEVVLGTDGETLAIRHDTFDRASFMPGVLLAIRGIGGLPGVTRGLEPLLGLTQDS